MNRGSLNSYTLNAATARGGPVRVAADLIGRAIVSASARVHRRYIGPITGQATVTTAVGRRVVRLRSAVTGEAHIVLLLVSSTVRGIADFTGTAVISLLAKVNRRSPISTTDQANVNVVGKVERRGPMVQVGQATVAGRVYHVWRTAPTAFLGVANIATTVQVFRLQLVRVLAAFSGQTNVSGAIGRREVDANTQVTAEARISLGAGVQNNFPYDEDAPEERTFIVAGEDNIFYVVD